VKQMKSAITAIGIGQKMKEAKVAEYLDDPG
jgi:hypothetical protein